MGYFPASYSVARAISKSDTVDFDKNLNAGLCDAIWVGGAGIVSAVFPGDTVVDFTCVAGTILPIRCKRVNSTTTSATVMVALYSI